MNLKAKDINTTALAYIGDAVYEIQVRKHCLDKVSLNVDKLHSAVVKFVRAEGQAKAVKKMAAENFLTEEEMAVYKRARNHKIASKPKNADPVTYKTATGFEALLGWLELEGQKERLEEVISRAVEIIEEM